MSNEEQTPKEQPVPQYQITEKCYLRVHGADIEKILDPEVMPFKKDEVGLETNERVPMVISFTGVPAHYMKPLNKAAEDMAAKHKKRMSFNDPIHALSVVGG